LLYRSRPRYRRGAHRCPIICRARTSCSMLMVRSAAAAVARCMRSARVSARCWTGCPAQLRVVRITRPKYACRARGSVAQALAPERPIAGELATPASLAQVLVSRYCDHTPLYRQSQIFARHGVDLSRSMPDGWRRVLVAGSVARPIVQERVCSRLMRRSNVGGSQARAPSWSH
jgi:hypothetical protein